MTINESLYFSFNGQNCEDFGIMNVSLNNGMNEEPFSPNRTLLEHRIRGNTKPYFTGVEYDPLTISLKLAFEEKFHSGMLRKVADWLSTDHYAPLIFESKPLHIYYAMLTNDGQLFHNSASQGYVTVNFRCDSPWAWTPSYSSTIDFSDNTETGLSHSIRIVGEFPVKPLLKIELISGNSFSITNTSNKGERLAFTGLADGEKLHIDCHHQTIDSNIPLVYRYGNQTDDSVFLTLLEGMNHLQIHGNVIVTFVYRGQLRG